MESESNTGENRVLESELVPKTAECMGIGIIKTHDTIHVSNLIREILLRNGPTRPQDLKRWSPMLTIRRATEDETFVTSNNHMQDRGT